jgi:molecular chaperone Hsp33
MNEAAPAAGDSAQRFLFEQGDVRGERVHLHGAYAAVLENHQYAPGVARLLGEFLAASVLLSSTLKFSGRLTLQARSQGEIPLIMAECSSQLQVRGIVRGAAQATGEQFDRLLQGGQLAITVEPHRGKPYQGIVPLHEHSLARSLDAYFAQSEQLPTRFWLASDGERAAGLLLQQLPAQRAADARQRASDWEHLLALSATLSETELLSLQGGELLYRLYHQEQLRVFEPRSVCFACSCSRERSRSVLGTLGRAEIEDILREQGSVTMDCEFCNQRYVFGADELLEPPSQQLH